MKPNLIALLLWVIMSLWACGSSRKVQDTTAVSNTETAVVKQIGKREAKNCLTAILDKSEYDLMLTHITYDTGSVRSDAVASKTILSVSGRKDMEMQKKSEESVLEDHTSVESHVYTDSIHTVDVSEKKETTVPKQIKDVVVWVCVAMLLGIAWVLLKKKI